MSSSGNLQRARPSALSLCGARRHEDGLPTGPGRGVLPGDGAGGLARGCFPETGWVAWLGVHSFTCRRARGGWVPPGFCVAHALASRGATAPPASGPPLGDAWSCYPRPICSWTAKAASDSIPCWSRVYTLSSHRKGSGRVVPALVRDLLQSASQVKKKKKPGRGT